MKETENILINAAREVTKEIIEKNGEEPFIRAELFESGTLMRLRYKVDPPRRQEVSTYIVKIIFKEFGKNPKVEFCYPKSDITYQWKGRIFPPHPAIMFGSLTDAKGLRYSGSAGVKMIPQIK